MAQTGDKFLNCHKNNRLYCPTDQGSPWGSTATLMLEEKLAGQKQIKALEAQRNLKRRSLFDAQDEVDRQREELIARIEGKLQQQTELVQLFEIRWSIQ